MAYSEFTLEKVLKTFQLNLSDTVNLFENVPELERSQFLQELLAYNVPIALGSNTEKSRSEMIIAPILIELRKQLNSQIGLFSGIDFTVAPELGLNGNCDFIITNSRTLLIMKSPIITVVEAKKENIIASLGQCAAEMYAARLFNERECDSISQIYGVVTTGEIWKFLKLKDSLLSIDLGEYFLNDVNKILGILASVIPFHENDGT
jgi:hypothetical protein